MLGVPLSWLPAFPSWLAVPLVAVAPPVARGDPVSVPLRILFLPDRCWQLCFFSLFFEHCGDVRLKQDTIGAIMLTAILSNGATPSIDEVAVAAEQVTHGLLFVFLGKSIPPVKAQKTNGYLCVSNFGSTFSSFAFHLRGPQPTGVGLTNQCPRNDFQA